MRELLLKAGMVLIWAWWAGNIPCLRGVLGLNADGLCCATHGKDPSETCYAVPLIAVPEIPTEKMLGVPQTEHCKGKDAKSSLRLTTTASC